MSKSPYIEPMEKAVYYYLPFLGYASYREFLDNHDFSTFVIGDEFCPRRFLSLARDLERLVREERSRRYVLATPPVYPLELDGLVADVLAIVKAGDIQGVIVNDPGLFRELQPVSELVFYLGRFANRHRHGVLLPCGTVENEAAEYMEGKVPGRWLRHPRVVGALWESSCVERLGWTKEVVVCRGPTRLALTRSCPLAGEAPPPGGPRLPASYRCSQRCLREALVLPREGQRHLWWGTAVLADYQSTVDPRGISPASELHFFLPLEVMRAATDFGGQSDRQIQQAVAQATPCIRPDAEGPRVQSIKRKMGLLQEEFPRLDIGRPYNSIGVSNIKVFRQLESHLSSVHGTAGSISELFLGLKFDGEDLALLRYPHRRNSECTSFSLGELRTCLARCRELGVKVAVAFNEIYPRGRFERSVLRHIASVAELGVDSLIVSDSDLIEEVRRGWPELHLTAGVGAGAFNAGTARYLVELGASRIVFTRKLYGVEMLRLYESLVEEPLELEFFAEPSLGCINHDACCYLHRWGSPASWNTRVAPLTCVPLWAVPEARDVMCRVCSAYFARLIQATEHGRRDGPSRKLTWKFSFREQAARTKNGDSWIAEILGRIEGFWRPPMLVEVCDCAMLSPSLYEGCPDHPDHLLDAVANGGGSGHPRRPTVPG